MKSFDFRYLKKNQVIVFVIALMLITAGYLNFTSNNYDTAYTSSNINYIEQTASIGDAKLVSTNVIEEGKLVDNDDMGNVGSDNKEDKNNNIDNSKQADNTIDKSSSLSTTTSSLTSSSTSILEDSYEVNSNQIDEYFSSSKLTRDTMYSQMLETYEKILANENIPADQKAISQTEIKNINDTKNRIMICENLIKTKGIQDCLIFVNGDSISVIIKSDSLEQNQIAQIQNIITREMQVDIENIHISNR